MRQLDFAFNNFDELLSFDNVIDDPNNIQVNVDQQGIGKVEGEFLLKNTKVGVSESQSKEPRKAIPPALTPSIVWLLPPIATRMPQRLSTPPVLRRSSSEGSSVVTSTSKGLKASVTRCQICWIKGLRCCR